MRQHEWDQTDQLAICRHCGRRVNTVAFDLSTFPVDCRRAMDPPPPVPGQIAMPVDVVSPRPVERPSQVRPFPRPAPTPAPAEPVAPRLPLETPGELAFVTCYFNPANVVSLRQNYLRFLADIPSFGVPVYVAEVAFPGQDFLYGDATLKIRATEDHLLWQKERLINHLVESLPSRFDKVGWIDADILFLDRQLAARTVEALALYPVTQLWGRWHFTDHRGTIVLTGDSVGHRAERFRRGGGHPGGAWAARRSVFPLEETHILGGADTTSLEGWLGIRQSFLQTHMTESWREAYHAWHADAFAKVQGEVTALEGEAIHLYHGSRTNRRYNDRSKWLVEAGYDPLRDLMIDDNGLFRWTSQAPQSLRDVVRAYWFDVRKEDEGLT